MPNESIIMNARKSAHIQVRHVTWSEDLLHISHKKSDEKFKAIAMNTICELLNR